MDPSLRWGDGERGAAAARCRTDGVNSKPLPPSPPSPSCQRRLASMPEHHGCCQHKVRLKHGPQPALGRRGRGAYKCLQPHVLAGSVRRVITCTH